MVQDLKLFNAAMGQTLCDVSRPTIARLETTTTKAKPETAKRLARVLKVKPEDLAGGGH